jgi:hypothetical protein
MAHVPHFVEDAMAKQTGARRDTVSRVMHEWKHRELESSRGGKVRSRRQAVAIALSESGTSNRQSKQQNQRQYARTKSKERHGQTAQQRKEGHSSTRQGRTQAERGTRSAEPTRAQLYQQAVRRQIANEQGRTGTSTTPIERELRSPRHAAALRLKYQWVTDAESALSNDAGLAGRMWLLRLRAEKDLSEPPPAPPRVHDL